MMQIVPKWKVTVYFPELDEETIWIYASSISDVLRKLADIQFRENGLTLPMQMIITEAK